MSPPIEDSYDQTSINRIVYNDKLGYAIVYYNPVSSHDVVIRPTKSCEHERHRNLSEIEPTVEEKFHEEVEAMVRRRTREDADKEIRKICQKVNEMYSQVEQLDMSRREVLNYRVRADIKGKSADEICDILVQDVLKHAKCVPRPRDYVNHKMKAKILAAAVERCPPAPVKRELEPEENSGPTVQERVDEYLKKDACAEIHERKYKRLLDRIQDDIKFLKYRCTEKINFNY